MPAGADNAARGIVAVTVLVAVSITETLSLPLLETYANVPAGFTATAVGVDPTATVAASVLVVASTTATVSKPNADSVMYTRVPAAFTATPVRCAPKNGSTVGTTAVLATSITSRLLASVM